MASLSPSELAALLGPALHEQPALVVSARTETARWQRFADEFARTLTARLRPLVRAAVRVQPSGGQALTAEAAGSAIDSRALVRFWQANLSLEPLAVVLSQPLVATFVDRLLGGRSAPSVEEPPEHRPLTDVDQQLATRLTDVVRQSVVEHATTEVSVELSELSPGEMSFAEAWLPNSWLQRLSFDLRFVQGGGTIDLLLPREVAEAFAAESADAAVPQIAQPGDVTPIAASPQRCSTIVARLAPLTLSNSDLAKLSVGDVILTETAPGQAFEVLIDGLPRFSALAGTLNGHKAIRLLARQM